MQRYFINFEMSTENVTEMSICIKKNLPIAMINRTILKYHIVFKNIFDKEFFTLNLEQTNLF